MEEFPRSERGMEEAEPNQMKMWSSPGRESDPKEILQEWMRLINLLFPSP